MSKLVSMYENYDRAELSYPGGPRSWTAISWWWGEAAAV